MTITTWSGRGSPAAARTGPGLATHSAPTHATVAAMAILRSDLIWPDSIVSCEVSLTTTISRVEVPGESSFDWWHCRRCRCARRGDRRAARWARSARAEPGMSVGHDRDAPGRLPGAGVPTAQHRRLPSEIDA